MMKRLPSQVKRNENSRVMAARLFLNVLSSVLRYLLHVYRQTHTHTHTHTHTLATFLLLSHHHLRIPKWWPSRYHLDPNMIPSLPWHSYPWLLMDPTLRPRSLEHQRGFHALRANLPFQGLVPTLRLNSRLNILVLLWKCRRKHQHLYSMWSLQKAFPEHFHFSVLLWKNPSDGGLCICRRLHWIYSM